MISVVTGLSKPAGTMSAVMDCLQIYNGQFNNSIALICSRYGSSNTPIFSYSLSPIQFINSFDILNDTT